MAEAGQVMAWKRGGEEPGGRAPAPGELAVVQAFLNSADLEDGIEAWTDPEALAHWLARWRLLDPPLALTDADVARAIRVREALRDVLSARDDALATTDAAARLADALGALEFKVEVNALGQPTMAPIAMGLDHALTTLMLIIYRASLGGTWERLKTCRHDPCRWVFYDASKNRSGNWCTMSICGAKRKARSYRQRKSAMHRDGPERAQVASSTVRKGP
jgi:predicted RNA-binding Zn ribbon-like protein